MVLSSALDNGNMFMCLIAILTSVISAVYYLYIVKHMFFEKSKFTLNISLKKILGIQMQEFNEKNSTSIITSSS
jgi:NADH-ubiquinone oxidoreductase chain 2